jgi:hypothetical protein
MSNQEDPSLEEEPESPPMDEEQAQAVRERLQQHLIEKWGVVPPPCPYCRIASWSIDPYPTLLQRFGQIPGFGIPVFLIWCTNCGHEVPIAVASTGLWEEVIGTPLEDDESGPIDPSPEATEKT